MSDRAARRSRRLYSTLQCHLLTEQYTISKHLNRETKQRLAKKLNLEEKDIVSWFRNARRRERRLKLRQKDSFCSDSSSTSSPLPALYSRQPINYSLTPSTAQHTNQSSSFSAPENSLSAFTQRNCEPFSEVPSPWLYKTQKEISPIRSASTCTKEIDGWMWNGPFSSTVYRITPTTSSPNRVSGYPVTPAPANSSGSACSSESASLSSPSVSPCTAAPPCSPENSPISYPVQQPRDCGSATRKSLPRVLVPGYIATQQVTLNTTRQQRLDQPIRTQSHEQHFGPIERNLLYAVMMDDLIPQVHHSTPQGIEASCLRLSSLF